MSVSQTVADVLRVLAGKDAAPYTTAIIVAAGSSTRMGGATSKQLLKVNGVPVLARTLKAFDECPLVDEIVLVARPEDEETITALQLTYRIKKLTQIVAGGDTRAASVKRGFDAIEKKTKYVAIHDGARCLVTPEMIERVLRAAYKHHAASAVSRVTDTVKLTSKRGLITETVDRDRVLLAGTPQAFRTDLYARALYAVGSRTFTDDNALMEFIRVPVYPVDCGTENIKITTPEDIGRAEDILARRAQK